MPKINSDINIDVDISVEEFFSEMSESDNKKMSKLLVESDDFDIVNAINQTDDKGKFYKELAYHVGVTDSEHLDALITELQYWSKK